MNKQKRILIVRPDRIGDVVLSTPIPREIKKTYPNSFVALLVRKYTADIYKYNPYVDKILLIDEEEKSIVAFFKKASEIRKYKFTHSMTLLPTERLNYLLFFAAIPYRISVGHKFYQFLTFTRYVDRKKYIPLRHEADYCMDLARRIGVRTENLDTEIFLTPDELKAVEIKKAELKRGNKYLVGIHITSGNSSPNWKAEEYYRLAEELSKIENISVVVTDNNLPAGINAPAGVQFPNIGKSLSESFINFASLDLLVSASTGPMHVAAALKVKTLSIFCPLTACSPKLWGPLGNKSRIVIPDDNYCQTVCPGDPKKCRFEGKGGIDASKILASILSFIK